MTHKLICYPPSDQEIAEFVGQTELNIVRTYKRKPHKKNFYYCLQIGTALSREGIDDIEFYEAMKIVKAVLNSGTLKRKMVMESLNV